MNSLIMECINVINKRNIIQGKEFVLQTIELPEVAQEIYMDNTSYKEIEIISNDRFGIDVKLDIFKQAGNITVFVHKKRRHFINVTICDAFGEVVYEQKNTSKIFSLFEMSLITDFPEVVSNFITNISKKWFVLSKFCVDVSRYHSKYFNVFIFIYANKTKKFIFNLDENHLMV